MKTHELARLLLELDNVPVVYGTQGDYFVSAQHAYCSDFQFYDMFKERPGYLRSPLNSEERKNSVPMLVLLG